MDERVDRIILVRPVGWNCFHAARICQITRLNNMRDCARGLSVVRLIKDIASSKIDKKRKLHFYIQIFNKRMHRSPIHIVLINVQIRRRTYKICTIYSPKRGELLRMHPGHPHPTSFFALPLSFRTLKPVFFLSLSLYSWTIVWKKGASKYDPGRTCFFSGSYLFNRLNGTRAQKCLHLLNKRRN